MRVTIITVALGLSLSVVWEFAEWAGYTYVSGEINVGYTDTLADLAAGGFGSLLSGVFLTFAMTRLRRQISVNAS